MEVSSHALVQERVSGFDFKVAVFTNLSHDHLDYHITIEEYARAKKILFDGLHSNAIAITNEDDEYGEFMVSRSNSKKTRFSFKGSTNHILSNTPNGLTLLIEGVNIQSPLIGEFNAYNIAQAFLTCTSLGFDEKEIARALNTATGAAGRMQAVKLKEGNTPLVIVDYAHTPDALENVSSTLSEIKEPTQKLTIVFGAGGDRDRAKRPEMAKTAQRHADSIFVTSDNPRFEDPEVIIDDIMEGFDPADSVTRITDRKEAIEQAISTASLNDIILIAGKGHEDYQDTQGTKHSFDDRIIAWDALKNYVKEAN